MLLISDCGLYVVDFRLWPKCCCFQTVACMLLLISDCGLYVVGSSMNGFGSNTSDMDLCLMLCHSQVNYIICWFASLHLANFSTFVNVRLNDRVLWKIMVF